MEILSYILIFIIGSLFGSFYSLAIYRIPIKQSIMHGRSYCPNCNHKLGFFDLIPIFSYIFLGGKCRYCEQKIRKRYILLEISTGLVFVAFLMSLNLNIPYVKPYEILYLVFGILCISVLYIIGGIEKEKHYISNSTFLVGVLFQFVHIIYLYMLNVNVYKYVIYLFFMLICILVNTIFLKKKARRSYTAEILTLCFYIATFVREELIIISIILTLFLIAIKINIISKKDNKENILINKNNANIPIGFYLCFTNIIMLVIQNFIF